MSANVTQSRAWWAVQDRDPSPAITGIALLGLFAAAAMAVFGLPPMDLHGPLHSAGIMDPLCGGTRAARYTMAGDLSMAWKYNPLGIVVVFGAAVVVVRAIVGVTAGWWFTPRIQWTTRRRTVAVVAGGALLVLLEIRQQMLAELLLAR